MNENNETRNLISPGSPRTTRSAIALVEKCFYYMWMHWLKVFGDQRREIP